MRSQSGVNGKSPHSTYLRPSRHARGMSSSVRLRAIRAAQVASLSVGLVSSAACSSEPSAPDAFALDAFGADDAYGPDSDGADAHVADVGIDAPTNDVLLASDASMPDASEDAGMLPDANCTTFPPASQECCLAVGGTWDGVAMTCAITAQGPFVPPAMNA